jgi:hypothetical protein
LHELGFSVQRPRKRLARADAQAQAAWLKEKLPAIKKKAQASRGLVMFGDEASFWLDGSLHRTWARLGVQPHVDTYGMRKTAHVFGALSLEPRPRFDYLFAPVFNGDTFLLFLHKLVARSRRKLFLILDNGPCHNLRPDGQAWLIRNRQQAGIEKRYDEAQKAPAITPLPPAETQPRAQDPVAIPMTDTVGILPPPKTDTTTTQPPPDR